MDTDIYMENKNNNGLTREELETFKKLLLVKRIEILSTVMSMEDETLRKLRTDLSNMPIHLADIGSENFEVENAIDLMDSEKRILSEIEDALERIEDKTYGICQNDDVRIPKARLEAIPWARYCIACANLREKGKTPRKEDYYDFPDNETDDME
jgi:RNA polymerase-binding protein DksA